MRGQKCGCILGLLVWITLEVRCEVIFMLSYINKYIPIGRIHICLQVQMRFCTDSGLRVNLLRYGLFNDAVCTSDY